MGEWLYTLIFYSLPWWAQMLVMFGVIAVPAYILAVAIFGASVANRYIIHGVIVIGTLGLASWLRQQGYRQRLAEEQRETKRQEAVAEEERREAEGLPDDRLNQKVDKWSKQ